MSRESKQNFTLGQRIVLAIAPGIVWMLLWAISRTWKYEVIAEDGVEPTPFGQLPGAQVWCFWHQCVLPCTVYLRKTRIVVIVSNSFDGELITRVVKKFGYGVVRGSSSRGGSVGLIGLKAVIDGGNTAVFTADGPVGPIYKAKKGPIKLAQITGAPITVMHAEPERTWVVNSWDHFLVPKPFTRIVFSWAKGPEVAADLATRDLEPKREELTAAIERARLRAIAHIAANPGSDRAARC